MRIYINYTTVIKSTYRYNMSNSYFGALFLLASTYGCNDSVQTYGKSREKEILCYIADTHQ